MNARRLECTAVFHERERMEEAVRGLLHNGMPTNRIRISQGARAGRPTRTERGDLLALGVAIGAMTGAALTLVWMFWLSDLAAVPLPLIAHRTADAAASGGIIGALFAFVVLAAHHRDRYELDTKADFIVRVRPPNSMVANDVLWLLSSRGGELVAAGQAQAPPSVDGYRRGAYSIWASEAIRLNGV